MTVPSKTYYVSSLHGSADFDGLTPQTPFLHPAQVSALYPSRDALVDRTGSGPRTVTGDGCARAGRARQGQTDDGRRT